MKPSDRRSSVGDEGEREVVVVVVVVVDGE